MNIAKWKGVWQRFAGRGVYPHELAFLLESLSRNLILSPQKLADHLHLSAGSCVLEIGPGPGFFSAQVIRMLFHRVNYFNSPNKVDCSFLNSSRSWEALRSTSRKLPRRGRESGILVFALPIRYFRSAWFGIIAHSGQSIFFAILTLGLVLGAPLYMFHWHRDALNFLSKHRAALAQEPVAISGSSGACVSSKGSMGARSKSAARRVSRHPGGRAIKENK